METLTQTPDTDTLFDDLKRRVEELKNASVEKFEQFLTLFNSNSVEEAPAVADADEIVEYGYATEEAVEIAEEVETEAVTAEAPEVAVETAEETETEELTVETPEATVETATDPVDEAQPQEENEVTEEVELTASTDEVEEQVQETEVSEENTDSEQVQTMELQEELDGAFIESIGVAPKADIEIRLDEIYSIRVVANEVISSIEELQNEVADLRAQVGNLVSHAELEDIVRNIVATTVRDRFAV